MHVSRIRLARFSKSIELPQNEGSRAVFTANCNPVLIDQNFDDLANKILPFLVSI